MHVSKNQGTYLLVEVTEPLSIVPSVFQEVADACQSQNLDKILIDMRTVHTMLSIFERYKAGIYVATIIGPKIKVAVVAQTALITYVAETVAVNRYGKLKVFTDMAEAMDWLEVGE